ncbi:MAG: hypothetical protein ABSD38_12565 [Syntrophorhabdales bacterium]|jgi:hypothetical protein
MIADQLEKVVTFLAMGATLLALVGFVSLFCFSIYGGWLRKKSSLSPFDAMSRQSR